MVSQIINNSKKLFDWIKGFIYIFKFDLMTLFFMFIIIITPFYPESLKSFLLQNKAIIGSVFQLAGVVFVLIGVYFTSVKEYLIEKKEITC